MLLKRVPWFRLGKDQVYIGGAFTLHSVNQFFFGQFVGGPYVALGTFKNAGLRINGCEKVPQLFVLEGLLNIQEAFENEELRSEEHTSQLQSHLNLLCRLLL